MAELIVNISIPNFYGIFNLELCKKKKKFKKNFKKIILLRHGILSIYTKK